MKPKADGSSTSHRVSGRTGWPLSLPSVHLLSLSKEYKRRFPSKHLQMIAQHHLPSTQQTLKNEAHIPHLPLLLVWPASFLPSLISARSVRVLGKRTIQYGHGWRSFPSKGSFQSMYPCLMFRTNQMPVRQRIQTLSLWHVGRYPIEGTPPPIFHLLHNLCRHGLLSYGLHICDIPVGNAAQPQKHTKRLSVLVPHTGTLYSTKIYVNICIK